MLFANFENDPYFLERYKYTSHPEFSKLLILSIDLHRYRMNVLPFIWYRKCQDKDKCPHKNTPLFSYTLSFLTHHI